MSIPQLVRPELSAENDFASHRSVNNVFTDTDLCVIRLRTSDFRHRMFHPTKVEANGLWRAQTGGFFDALAIPESFFSAIERVWRIKSPRMTGVEMAQDLASPHFRRRADGASNLKNRISKPRHNAIQTWHEAGAYRF